MQKKKIYTKKSLPMLWKFIINDKNTWPYLDCIIETVKGKEFIRGWIKNPNFAYPHLIKGFSNERKR